MSIHVEFTSRTLWPGTGDEDVLAAMQIGDRICYRAGTAPAETGTVTAVTVSRNAAPTIEVLLDTGARIKVVASPDWTLVTDGAER